MKNIIRIFQVCIEYESNIALPMVRRVVAMMKQLVRGGGVARRHRLSYASVWRIAKVNLRIPSGKFTASLK